MSKYYRSNFYRYKIISGLFFLFFLADIIKAQSSDIIFNNISIEEGLSQSGVLCILQDKKGLMWFGTQDGLNKYDGTKITVYRYDPDKPNSISLNYIRCLYEDKNGNLWIGIQGGGLNRYDYSLNKFYSFKHNPNNPKSISDNTVTSICEDPQGNLWIGTESGLNRINSVENGVSRLNFTHYYHQPNNPKSLSFDNIQSVFTDNKGNLWVGTFGGGLNLYNKEKNEFTHYADLSPSSNTLKDNQINCIYEDKSGRIWIGTFNGLKFFDSSSKQFTSYRNDPNNSSSLGHNDVRVIYEDSKGILWVGTDEGGLSKTIRENNRITKFINYKNDPNDPHSLSENRVQSIYEDQSGILWIGTWTGGVNKIDLEKKKFRLYQHDPNDPRSLSNNGIYSLLIDKQQTLWIGTVDGLNRYDKNTGSFIKYRHDPKNPNTITSNRVWGLYEHPDQAGKILWVGSNMGLNRLDRNTGKVTRFQHNPDDSTSLSNDRVFRILKASPQSLWIATDGAGLNLLDFKTNKFTCFKLPPHIPNSVAKNRMVSMVKDKKGMLWIGTRAGLILFNPKEKRFVDFQKNLKNTHPGLFNNTYCLYADPDNNLWIGTDGKGIIRLNLTTNQITHYGKKDGMLNNVIYGLLMDKKGNIWFSSNQGISMLNPKTTLFKNYDVSDGLQSNEFNQSAFCMDKSGKMYFAGINGMNTFYPDSIKDNSYIPPIVITDFKLFNREVEIGKKKDDRIILPKSISYMENIELSYLDDVISFEFAALHFAAPENNNYAYIMENFENEWNYTNNRNFATYTNLSPGEYIFRVKGTNNDGVWNETGTSLKIFITPPYWQTTWFRIIGTIFVILSVLLLYKKRTRTIKESNLKLEKRVKQRTSELRQEISDRKKADKELRKMKRETDDILNNVKEGLFLINSKFAIESQHSTALENIIGEKDLAGKNIISILEDKVTSEVLSNAVDYLEIMFNPELDETMIGSLNPMSKVEYIYRDEDGAPNSTKFLSFDYKRVINNQKFSELIVTVTDITQQVLLGHELQESKKQSKKQIELLVNILHVEPQLLKEFIESVKNGLHDIFQILKNPEQNQSFNVILNNIYRSIRLIEGNASLLDLTFFTDKTRDCEEVIRMILAKPDIQSKDFISINLKLVEIESAIEDVKTLIGKVNQIHSHFRPKRSYEGEKFVSSIKNFISHLIKDSEKEIQFKCEKFDVMAIPHKYRLLIKDILIQLVQNAVFHGIEAVKIREKKKKSGCATIELESHVVKNKFEFSFRDDGRGVQLEKIKERAIESGKWESNEVEKFSKKQFTQLIFESGISTSEKIDISTSRGMGMDVIQELLKRYNGTISLDFKKDKFTEFIISLPLS